MSLQNIFTKLQTLHTTVTGITRAYTYPPNSINTGDAPCIWAVPDTGEYSLYSQNGRRIDHHVIVRIYGTPIGQGADPEARLLELTPFVERISNLYLANQSLESTDYVVSIDADSYQFVVAAYGKTNWAALEFRVTVTEKEDGVTIAL